MIQIIILSLAVFFMTNIQNLQAQTKEETIAWIKEKLEQHGGGTFSSFSDINVSPCNISFTEKYQGSKEYKISFNPSSI